MTITQIFVKFLFERKIMLKFARNYYKNKLFEKSFKKMMYFDELKLGGMFLWSETTEGTKYWRNIFEDFKNYLQNYY